MGREDGFYGVIDLITMKGIVWEEEDMGQRTMTSQLPPEYQEAAKTQRDKLFDKLSLLDDEFMEHYLEGGPIDESVVIRALRKATIELKCVPVLCGAALRNKGIPASSGCDCFLSAIAPRCAAGNGRKSRDR
jgi:elongation factor G